MQYFRPALSYHLSLRPLFCLFLSGRFRQVSLYLLNWTLIHVKTKPKITFQQGQMYNFKIYNEFSLRFFFVSGQFDVTTGLIRISVTCLILENGESESLIIDMHIIK